MPNQATAIQEMTYRPCWCGSINSHLLTIDNATLLLCDECATARVLTVPDHYRAIYESGTYHTSHQEDIGKESYASQSRQLHDFQVAEVRILDQIGIDLLQGKVLDVGCGNGSFVLAGRINGLEVYGLDLCKDAVWPEIKHRVFLGGEDSTDIEPLSMDVITLFDVLEHFEYPVESLLKLRCFLKPGGLMIIEGPVFGGTRFEITPENRHHIRPIEHPWNFSLSAYVSLLTLLGIFIIPGGTRFPIPGKVTLIGKVRHNG